MLTNATQRFIKSLSVDPDRAAPLIQAMTLLAEAIEEADTPSASLFAEYTKIHDRLMKMSAVDVVDPVEALLNAVPK